MNYNTLLYELDSGVLTITFNRPDRYNAFNNEMSAEFIDALKKADKDSAVRAIVITGSGKAFCSGQDLKDVAGVTRSLGESVANRYNPKAKLIQTIEKPFIAKLNGIAAGAGAGVAIACDYIIASEQASLLFAFVNIGLVLDTGSSFTLPRLVGYRKAFEYATLGNKISAVEALTQGIVNQVVSPELLDSAAAEIAQKYATSASKAIGLIKRMLHQSGSVSLEKALESEMFSQEIAGKTHDYIEGVSSFVEKRSPNFTGN